MSDSLDGGDARAKGDSAGGDPSSCVLCYLICPQDASGAFVGALMLTDGRTRPLHFGYVSPIKPTAMQRLLYGPTLREHLKIDVIANKLFDGLPQVPDVTFVDSSELLCARRLSAAPLALLARRDPGTAGSPNLSTVVYDTNDNADDREAIGSLIARLEPQVDLVEPFARMIEVLKEAIKVGRK